MRFAPYGLSVQRQTMAQFIRLNSRTQVRLIAASGTSASRLLRSITPEVRQGVTSAMVSMPDVTGLSEGCSVSPHRENLGPVCGQFERTTHLEPVPFVQCDVRRVAGLQICRHPGVIDPAQVPRQQAEPISSPPVLDTRAQQT